HGPAVVGVQDELAGLDVLGRARRSDQGGRELHRLLLVDVPADDLAAPDVEDEVEVVEGPADTRTEVGDVPAPQLARAARDVGAGSGPDPRRPRMIAMSPQLLRVKEAVKR